MTAPGWTRTAAEGCTAPACGTQHTVTIDGHHGRRCERHQPEPCRIYSDGADGWCCQLVGPHQQHRNAAGDLTW